MQDEDEPQEIVQTDPSGRFERYVQCLGKGAYKEVYKAFDQEEGVEVAWNQLRIEHLTKKDFLRILSEIQILEKLRNENIINLFHHWTTNEKGKDQIYFITELMTSGTLKAYIKRTKGLIKPKVLKNWGQAKIGDLGLATFKSKEHVSSVLGTPEFMAPELYEEKYDEKVDIYAFGMVLLEIVTREYPYSECTNQAQIYKKVTSGIKPAALCKIADEETRRFIEFCIEYDPSNRPSAPELLSHPFLINITGSSFDINSLDPSSLILSSMNFEKQDSAHNSKLSRSETIDPSNLSRYENNQTAPITRSNTIQSVDSSISDSSNRSYSHLPMYYFFIVLTRNSQAFTPSTPNRISSPFDSSILDSKKITQVIDANNHTFQVVKSPAQPLNTDTLLNVKIESENDSSLLLKMVYSTASRRLQEISFPFNLSEDTANDVVNEMVSENLIEAKDEQIARRKIEEIVRTILIRKRFNQAQDLIQNQPQDLVPNQLLIQNHVQEPIQTDLDDKNGNSFIQNQTISMSTKLIQSIIASTIPDPTSNLPPIETSFPPIIPPMKSLTSTPTDSIDPYKIINFHDSAKPERMIHPEVSKRLKELQEINLEGFGISSCSSNSQRVDSKSFSKPYSERSLVSQEVSKTSLSLQDSAKVNERSLPPNVSMSPLSTLSDGNNPWS